MKKKILSWRLYKEGISEMGFFFSVKNFIFAAAALMICVNLVALAYKLNLFSLIFLSILSLICLPSIIKSRFIYKYEEKRFMDLCSYMEQVCSSFQKQPKILSALKDSGTILDGKLKSYVEEAVSYIEKGISGEKDIYTEALKIIENHYSCKRLISLHKFLIRIETHGGEHHNFLNILLQDIHSWRERTVFLQGKKKSLRVNYVIVLFLSLISCMLATLLSYMSVMQKNFMSGYLDITGNLIYQLVTTVFLASCILSFVMIQKKLGGSWLDYAKNEKMILEDYKVAENYPAKKKMIRRLPAFILSTLVSYALIMVNRIPYALMAEILVGAYIVFPSIKYNGARKRTREEIQAAFPEWLRDIALNLQFQTVQMSIQYSLETAPVILREDIKTLIAELDIDPSGITPYHHFLGKFDLTEVKSAMLILYSMGELSYDNTQEMLDVLIQRNYVMIDKAEKTYQKNKILILNQLLYLPMCFSMVKVIIDLFLFAASFFNGFSDFSSFQL